MRDHYHGRAAMRYDAVWRTFSAHMLAPVIPLALASLSDQALVLDVGCGTGFLLAALRGHRPDLRLWGTDSSADMLAQAHARLGEHAHLLPWDVEQPTPLALRNAAPFDLITCTNVIHYLHAPTRTIQQLAQMLRPDGRLLLADFTVHGWWWPLFEGVLHLADGQHRQTLTPLALAQTLHDAGLSLHTTQSVTAGMLWRGTVVEGIQCN